MSKHDLESEALRREMGYLPGRDEGEYIMTPGQALVALINGVANKEEGASWADPEQHKALKKILDDDFPQDINKLSNS
jgi:hypothetical protein